MISKSVADNLRTRLDRYAQKIIHIQQYDNSVTQNINSIQVGGQAVNAEDHITIPTQSDLSFHVGSRPYTDVYVVETSSGNGDYAASLHGVLGDQPLFEGEGRHRSRVGTLVGCP